MRWTILCGGPAGQGPNLLSSLISKGLVEKGFFVFTSRDYESRIRGGHNFNLITFSDMPLMSNDSVVDILISLDELSEKRHEKDVHKNTFVIKDKDNVKCAGMVYKLLGLDFSLLDKLLQKLSNYEENKADAKAGYDSESRSLPHTPPKKHTSVSFMIGNEAIAIGAIESGLEVYYGYPMTPATGVLTELSQRQANAKHITVELENEISVINASVGSAMTGAKTMLGTSGGGFDLMTEGLSLAGATSTPLVIHLAQRPGPATGVPTYTSQADLNLARHSGHGEFNRVVVAPGDTLESIEKTTELFYLSQKYLVPTILLTDKHLVESAYTKTEKPKLKSSSKSITWPNRVSSYILSKKGYASDDPEDINGFFDKMKETEKKMSKEIESMQPYKIFGKKDSKTVIIGWGSTKGAILDAIIDLPVSFIQVLYLEPFTSKLISLIQKSKNILVVENNATSQLSMLIAEKTGIIIPQKNKILRYDGRPFFADELNKEIKKRI